MAVPTWELLAAGYCGYLAAIGRPPTTIQLRRGQVTYLARTLAKSPRSVSYQDLIDFYKIHSWKPETRRSYRAGLRGFFAWAQKSGHLTDNPAEEIPQFRVPKASARPCPETIYREALVRADERGRLILRLAREAGLRRGEIAQAHRKDLIQTSGGWSLLVHGKGANERVVPINDGLAGEVMRADGWLFPSQRGGHLRAKSVGVIGSQLLGDEVTLHQLRHSFATAAYRGSRNLRAVQKLLGHSSLAITERYLEADDDEMRAAMLTAVA